MSLARGRVRFALGLALASLAPSCVLDLGGLEGGSIVKPCTKESDTTNDPENCGRCGASCLGGTCVDSECTPALVGAFASAPMSPWGIGATDTDVYFTASDGASDVHTFPKTSRDPPRAFGGNHGGAGALAVDAEQLFYASKDGIVRCATAGSCDDAVYASSGAADVRAIALDGDHVYWTEAATGAGDGRVMQCARDADDCATSAAPLAANLTSPEAIAVHAGYVYWSELGPSSANGRVARVATSGGTVEPMLSTSDSFHGVLVSGDFVFATTWSSDRLLSCTLPCGMSFNDLTAGAAMAGVDVAKPLAIGIDDGTVYWTNSGGSSLSDVAEDGTAIEDTVEMYPGPLGLVIDDTYLFWTDAGGNVYRLLY